MMQPKAELKQIELKNMVTKDIQAYADSGMVNTVIRNLVSNALKFTESGGIVTIAAAVREQDIEMSVTIPDTVLTRRRLTCSSVWIKPIRLLERPANTAQA